jgi:hypothetical protein
LPELPKSAIAKIFDGSVVFKFQELSVVVQVEIMKNRHPEPRKAKRAPSPARE